MIEDISQPTKPVPSAVPVHEKWSFIFTIAFAMAVISVVSAVGGYALGRADALNFFSDLPEEVRATPSPLTSPTASPSPKLYRDGKVEIIEENITIDDTINGTLIKLPDLNQIRLNAPAGSNAPAHEVFIFGDFTEDGFSKRALTTYPDAFLQADPSLRLWYVHTVLDYRNKEYQRPAITSLRCLSEQSQLWNNMKELTVSYGRFDGNYTGINRETFDACASTVNNDAAYINRVVTESQERMPYFDFDGIPTTLFVSTEDPSRGIVIPGAVPVDILVNNLPAIFKKLE